MLHAFLFICYFMYYSMNIISSIYIYVYMFVHIYMHVYCLLIKYMAFYIYKQTFRQRVYMLKTILVSDIGDCIANWLWLVTSKYTLFSYSYIYVYMYYIQLHYTSYIMVSILQYAYMFICSYMFT